MKSKRIMELRNIASGTIEVDAPCTAIAYGYTRVSHVDSLKKGDSLPAQEQRIRLYYETKLKEKGVVLGGVENDGTNISAYSVPFCMRPAGKELLAKLQPGDHLILDKVDRIWRSIEDFCSLMKEFREKNITVHIVNFLGESIQNDTPLGDFVLRLFVLVAELESAIKSERTKEGLSYYLKKGNVIRSCPPPGTTFYEVKGDNGRTYKRLKWNPKQRAIMNEIVRLRDEERREWSRCFKKIEEFIARLEGRKVRPIKDQKSDRTHLWKKLYKWETGYRYLKIEDPNKIPNKDIVTEAARQWRRERSERLHATLGFKYQSERRASSTIDKIDREELLRIASCKG